MWRNYFFEFMMQPKGSGHVWYGNYLFKACSLRMYLHYGTGCCKCSMNIRNCSTSGCLSAFGFYCYFFKQTSELCLAWFQTQLEHNHRWRGPCIFRSALGLVAKTHTRQGQLKQMHLRSHYLWVTSSVGLIRVRASCLFFGLYLVDEAN